MSFTNQQKKIRRSFIWQRNNEFPENSNPTLQTALLPDFVIVSKFSLYCTSVNKSKKLAARQTFPGGEYSALVMMNGELCVFSHIPSNYSTWFPTGSFRLGDFFFFFFFFNMCVWDRKANRKFLIDVCLTHTDAACIPVNHREEW